MGEQRQTTTAPASRRLILSPQCSFRLSASPAASMMFTAAFRSLSTRCLHPTQTHSRMFNGFLPLGVPQIEQVWVVGANLSTRIRVLPCSAAFSAISRVRCPQLASSTLLPNRVLARPLIVRVSRVITWFSLTIWFVTCPL